MSLLARTLLIIALGGAVQFAYFGLFFWLPPYLARPVAQGGAGMGVVGSLQWIVLMQIGAYFGYLTFGFIADRLGRRRTFVLFMIAAAIIAPLYGKLAATSPVALLVLSPLLGYFGHGYFSMFGGFVAELYPTGGARDGSRHELQPGPDARRVRTVHDRRARRLARRRNRTRAERHVGFLPARGRAGLHAAGSQRAGARIGRGP